MNIANLVVFVLLLVYYLIFEIFKISKSVRFYYGAVGTSYISRAKNEVYINNQQPLGLLKFYAALNIIVLIWIFGNAIANCVFIYKWVKGTSFIQHQMADMEFRRATARKLVNYNSAVGDSIDSEDPSL